VAVIVCQHVALLQAQGAETVGGRSEVFAGGELETYLRDLQQHLNEMLSWAAFLNQATYVDTYSPSIGHDPCQMDGVKWIEGMIPDNPAAANLTRVLTTPLMVALARTIYSDDGNRSPAMLLDTNRFSTSATLEDHLLGSFIASVYRMRQVDRRGRRPRHWNPERAEHWLAYLAGHLHQLGTRDLAWWELGTTMRRSSRVLVIGFLAGVTFAVVTAVGNLPVDVIGTSLGLDFALRRGLVVGLLHGLVGGLVFSLLHWFADHSRALKPAPARLRLFGGQRQLGARFVTRVSLGITLGCMFALVQVLLDRLVVARLGSSLPRTEGVCVAANLFLTRTFDQPLSVADVCARVRNSEQ